MTNYDVTPMPQFNDVSGNYITAKNQQELYIVLDDVNKFEGDNFMGATQKDNTIDYLVGDNVKQQYSATPITHLQANKSYVLNAPTLTQFLYDLKR